MRLLAAFMVLLILVSGCTICERPFIKINGDCCLDDDNNNICDFASIVHDNASAVHGETVQTAPDEKNPGQPAGNDSIFRYALSSLVVSSRIYEPTPDGDTDVIVSTMGYKELKGAELTFIPMCGKDHLMGIMLNGKLVDSVNVACGKMQNITLSKDSFQEGRNPLRFSTANGPFLIKKAAVRLHFENSPVIEQDFLDFVAESVKRTIDVGSKSQAVMQNYYDQSFSVTEREYPGDFKLSFNADSSGLLVIYLNGRRIYEGEISKGRFNLNLPKDDIRKGTNNLRYIILP